MKQNDEQKKPGVDVTPEPAHSVEITGRFDQYRSSYWAAKLATFGARYPFRPFSRGHVENEMHSNIKRHSYSAAVGGLMESVTAFFALRTWKDMKSIFRETLAWEFNKDPEDVGLTDFIKSKNTMVQQTLQNYVRYNTRRVAIDLFWFAPMIAGPIMNKLGVPKTSKFHPQTWHFETGADLGLGANAAYLFSDVINRRITPFESLQSVIDRKINHTDHINDKMTADDLLDIYERHAANGPIESYLGKRGTSEWKEHIAPFERMAELINQTYANEPTGSPTHFTMSEFIHMVGHKLIDPNKREQTMAFIEIADKYGMGALSKVVNETSHGGDLATAMRSFPLDIPQEQAAAIEENLPDKAFTKSIQPRSPATYTRPDPAASHVSKLGQETASLTHSLG